jgi:hypothetical protein
MKIKYMVKEVRDLTIVRKWKFENKIIFVYDIIE